VLVVEAGFVGANVQAGDWVLLTENRKAVLAALERGETDGIVPAASGFMDRFAEFMIELGIAQVLQQFPDHRKRRWIDAFLFCNVMLHKAIFRLDSLSSIGPFLFSSPAVMKTLGFNLAQITKGVYEGCAQKPFNEEAMSDFFAACSPDDFLSNQKMLAKWLLLRHPEIIEDGSLIMDCLYVRIPAGKCGKEQSHVDVCLVCGCSGGELFPLLWSLLPANTSADVTQGKALIDELLPIADKHVKRLIVDRGFMSGEWVGQLKGRGIDTVIGLRSDMTLHQDMLSLATQQDTIWLEARPPRYHGTRPARHIAYLSDLNLWEQCSVPLAGIVIRDTYTDRTEFYTVVTTDLAAEPEQIHEWMRSRWAIEETFMEESRYGSLNCVGSCRPAVASATAHFSFLAYTLLKLFARKEQTEEKLKRPTLPFAGLELVVYWGANYAIIHTSRLIEIVAKHSSDWGDKLGQMLQKLRAIEEPP
jgi:Transposase DDE domain